MKRHLFLTGPSGCGKTTIIQQELGDIIAYAGGFITRRITREDGSELAFELYPAAAAVGAEGYEAYRFMDYSGSEPKKDNEVFRGPAVRLLEEAENYPFALIDEFGGFEILIPQFRQALEGLLNSELPVIGVLKGAENAEELRRHFGLGEKFTLLADKLRRALEADEDTAVIELKSRGDESVRRIVRQWVREYASF